MRVHMEPKLHRIWLHQADFAATSDVGRRWCRSRVRRQRHRRQCLMSCCPPPGRHRRGLRSV